MSSTDDIGRIRKVMDERSAAMAAKDAQRVMAQSVENTTVFSLAPPLVTPTAGGAAGLDAWFATWRGGIGYDTSRLEIAVDGNLAIAFGLAHMKGDKTDGARADLWFRETLAFRREQGAWKIMHQHSSVPFYMDGSFRAAVDLKPDTQGAFDMSGSRQDAPPDNELVLTRVLDLPAAAVWQVWTTPELLQQWWTPRPWTTTEVSMDLRPGGLMHTVMRSPEGQEFPYDGCFLELVPNRRIVVTNALGKGYRPSDEPFFTAIVELEPLGPGRTRYTARVIHRDAEGRKKHEEMGFHEGWGKALDQLVEVASRLRQAA